MGVSIPRLPEQSVEDIMDDTPDDRNKDRINIHERRVMDGQGSKNNCFIKERRNSDKKNLEKKETSHDSIHQDIQF